MSVGSIVELNKRHIKLADRCRSQWTFYQLLQGLHKYLRYEPSPPDIDFRETFEQLKELGANLSNPDVTRLLDKLTRQINLVDSQLRDADVAISPSLLRRFFDHLSNRDEKVLLAIIKFYLDAPELNKDIFDKLDVLLTRLAEIPKADGGFVAREKHELERLVTSLLSGRDLPESPPREIQILLQAVGELRGEILSKRTFSELLASGSLDRFRNLKRRLGISLLHPQLLPAMMEATVAIKNRFKFLWEEEEPAILEDTNRAMEVCRQLERNPEMLTTELQEAVATFNRRRQQFEEAKAEDNLRTEDIRALRESLTTILEQLDYQQRETSPPSIRSTGGSLAEETAVLELLGEQPSPGPVATDPLLNEYLNKIIFALELAGKEKAPAQLVQAREVAALRLETWEAEACLALAERRLTAGLILHEQAKLFALAAALRIKADEEAREIDRLSKRSSERLAEVLEQATQTLQRAQDLDRRFSWFIEDALYRGSTEFLERLYRSRFRLLRAYSGLWLIHNERGGISPF